jgi:adenylyltransferase/sulfurtransferase
VLGILPGVIGSIQATETLKILLGKGTSLSGRLLLYDALEMSFREVRLGKDPDAPTITKLIDYDQFCGVPKMTADPRRLSPQTVSERRAAGWAPWVLDVRRATEAEIVSLPFTDDRIQHDQLGEHLDRVPRDRDVLVYCRSGARSQTAVRTLEAAGFSRLFDLDGGIMAWSAQVDPSLPRY